METSVRNCSDHTIEQEFAYCQVSGMGSDTSWVDPDCFRVSIGFYSSRIERMRRDRRYENMAPAMIAPTNAALWRCLAFMFDHGLGDVPSTYASAFVCSGTHPVSLSREFEIIQG